MSNTLTDKLNSFNIELSDSISKIKQYQNNIFYDLLCINNEKIKFSLNFTGEANVKASYSLKNNPSHVNHSIDFTFYLYKDELETTHFISFASNNSNKKYNNFTDYIEILNIIKDFIENVDKNLLVDLLQDYKKSIRNKLKFTSLVSDITHEIKQYKLKHLYKEVFNFLLDKDEIIIEDFLLNHFKIDYKKDITVKEKNLILFDKILENDKHKDSHIINKVDLFVANKLQTSVILESVALSFNIYKNKIVYNVNFKKFSKKAVNELINHRIKVNDYMPTGLFLLNKSLKLDNNILKKEEIEDLHKKLLPIFIGNKISHF